MEENEEFDSDFSTEDVPISEGFWNYMENYWHNNREFPESTESSLNKKADLVDGKVPASQLPSYVDDVLEFDTFENLPNPGEKSKIYLITSNNTQFRWSGSEYIQLNSDENLMTVNSEQNVTGKKYFITSGGSTDQNNKLIVASFDHSLPGMTFHKSDFGSGNINFNEDGFNFVNAQSSDYINSNAKGFKKSNSNDEYLLTGGGGHINKHTKEDSYLHSSRDFTEGTLIKTNVDYSVDYGHQFLLEMKGNMYSGNLPLEMKVQGYIYYGTIISTRGYSTYPDLKVITALNLDGKLCFWFPRLGYWQGFSVKLTIGYGGLENGVNRVIAVEDSPDPQGTKRVEIYIDTLATQEWANSKHSNNITAENINNWNSTFNNQSNNVTLSDVQNITGQKNFSNSIPLTFKSADKKSWAFHKPLNDSLMIAPSQSLNGEDWDWKNQINFGDNGNITSNGYIKEGSDDNWLLTGGGGHLPKNQFSLDNHTHEFLQSNDTGIVDANSLFEDYKFKFNQRIENGSENMFPVIDNANSIISIASHPGGYGVQLGFNDNEESYIRSVTAGNFGKWKQFAYKDWVLQQIPSLNNYVPYTEATQDINLNNKSIFYTQKLHSSGSHIHGNLGLSVLTDAIGGYVSNPLIKIGAIAGNMITFTVKLYNYPYYYYEFQVNIYIYQNNVYEPRIIWRVGESAHIDRIEFFKDQNTGLFYIRPIISVGYPRLAITDVQGYRGDSTFFNENWSVVWDGDTTPLLLQGTINSVDFSGDSRVVNTHKAQEITARKVINKDLGTNEYIGVAQHNAQFQIGRTSDAKSLEFAVTDDGVSYIQSKEAGIGYHPLVLNRNNSGGVAIGGTPVVGHGLTVNGSIYSAEGYHKAGVDNNYILLAGGGHKLISDFVTSPQLGNYVTTAQLNANDRNYITDSRGAIRPPSFYDDRYAQWDFQHGNDTLASGDAWQGILTVAKWDEFNAAHRQEQLLFTGDDLKRRTATSDDNWGEVKTIWDSGNLNPSSFVNQATLDNYLLKSGGTMTGMVNFSNNTGGISGTMGDNDYYRIIGKTNGSDNGYLEIATADGGVEGVHVTQYTGQFTTPVRTAKLLDENGNTYFPQNITAEYAINAGSDSQISGRVFGKRELIDATGLNQDTYYPVAIKLPNLYTSKIKVYRTLDSSMGVPAYSDHGAGFWCYFEFDDYGRGWGVTDNLSVCNYQQQNWTNIIPIGYSTINESSDSIVWVRGGSKYWIDVNSNTPIVLYPNGYTSPYGQTVNPTTVRPWIDINKNILSRDLINYWSKSDFNIADYATQSWVTSQGYLTPSNLNGYATESWISANFPNQTLATGVEGLGGQTLTLSNGNTVTITNNFITSPDGTRNPNDIKPNTSGNRVRFDFANASSVKGSGNYAGVMTYAPWDGTTSSTGDSSYQLAFANQTGINGEGIPMLKLRKGIDDHWSADWYKMWSEGDFSQSDINNWNNIANTAATQSWVESQDYATHSFVEENLNQINAEYVNPDFPILATNKFTTVIITEEYPREHLDFDSDLIPERQITVINLAPFDIDVRKDDNSIDRIFSRETTEYYISSEKRLIKKGSYRDASILS